MERHGWGFGASVCAIIFLFSTFAGATVQPNPAVLYVDASATGANTGASWADAFTDLQSALEAALAGDEIWVVAGTYKPGIVGQRYKAFQLKNGVGLYGGFSGTETDRAQRDWEANMTILSGDLKGNDNNNILPTEPTRQDNCYHVIYNRTNLELNASAVLDGFTVTGGNANGSNQGEHVGGGIYNEYCSPTINHCIFKANSTTSMFSAFVHGFGGGMMNHAGSPIISNCAFVENYSGLGGGISNVSESNPVITNCVFSNNTVTSGGGVYSYSSNPLVANCTFMNNSATEFGGGMCNMGSSQPSVTNCTFSGNSAFYGGGICNYSSNPSISNCILWNNTAQIGPQIDNYAHTSNPLTIYNDIQGGWTGEGNMDADPLFVDAANGDLRLQPGSPCIDKGSNAVIPAGITTDLAGNPRIVDGNSDSNPIVDMGAYEFTIHEKVAAPVILPAGGTYNAEQNVTMTCATSGAVIRYTLDGSDPNYGMVYEAGTTIPVEQSLTLRAVGLNAYMIPSEGAVAAYRLVVATPTFTPDYGHYLTDQTVQIACATPGATIYYTIDGSDPAQSGIVIENGGTITVSVNPATTLKAIAFKGNMEPSAIKSAPYAQSHIIYVNTAATGANNGKTWANAFTRLQYALDVAMPWDEIWVVAGTYKPTKAVGGTELPFRTFQMKDGVDIYGGFNGTETSRDQRDWQANPTILSGDLYGDDVITPSGPFPWGKRGENCYHVVRGPGYYPGKGNTVLDGFTIIGGNAISSDNFNGGGMYNSSSYVTIRHCIFTANSALSGMGNGGAVYNTNSSPLIMDCVFINNYAYRGGGMANYSGSNPTIISCVFTDNFTVGGNEANPSKGGGMYNWSSSSPILTNCIFNGNSSVLGGAVYNYSNSRPVFTNCTLTANSASTAGGALFNMIQSSPTMTNCILWDNAAPMGPVMYSDSSDPIITYSNVEGGWTGEGNIDAAPLFVDAANGDLRLQAGSPCIDAGGNAAIPAGGASDLAGTPRIVDGNCDGNAVVDMGAYEYFLIGDLNSTCGVDMSDFDILAAHWLMDGCTSPDNCGQADIDRNGVVEMEDFIQFAEQWLQLTTK